MTSHWQGLGLRGNNRPQLASLCQCNAFPEPHKRKRRCRLVVGMPRDSAAVSMRWLLQYRGPLRADTLADCVGVPESHVQLLLQHDLKTGRVYRCEHRYYFREGL